nr:transposase [Couchioplanes caeruleus]
MQLSSSRAGRTRSSPPSNPAAPHGRRSWDTVRLGPADDTTAVTATQLRTVVQRLTAAGQHTSSDPDMLIVCDAGYDVTRLAYVLRDLPVEVCGRIRADRVLRLPAQPALREPADAHPSTAPSST